MSNPIINVVPAYGSDPNNGTIYIGRQDGTFDALDGPPYPPNVRGVISHAFLGSPDGGSDTIVSLNPTDFGTVKGVWAQMCRGRSTSATLSADQVSTITAALVSAGIPQAEVNAIAAAVRAQFTNNPLK